MSSYTITSPSIDAVISDDVLYFEGIRRPLIAYALREDMVRVDAKQDSFSVSEEHIVTLERYFTDIYNLFMKKLVLFSGEEAVSDASSTKLQALLQEMIKIKGLIQAAHEAHSALQDKGK